MKKAAFFPAYEPWFINVLLLLALVALSNASVIPEECVLSGTSCPCKKKKTTTNKCMSNLGNGSCLLETCQEIYQCDCSGFEICDITSCETLTETSEAVLSAVVSFDCVLAPNSGNCLTPNGIRTDAVGARNAGRTAFFSLQTAVKAASELANSSFSAVRDKGDVHDALAAMDLTSLATESEDALATSATSSVNNGTQAVANALREAGEALAAERQAERWARVATAVEEHAKLLQRQLGFETGRRRNGSACPSCDTLRDDIGKDMKLLGMAATRAVEWAKRGAENAIRAMASKVSGEKTLSYGSDSRAVLLEKSEAALNDAEVKA